MRKLLVANRSEIAIRCFRAATELGLMAGSAVLHSVYFILLNQGYRVGDLSLVYPLARGTGPLISTIAAILLLGERPSALAVAGALLIIGGVVALDGEKEHELSAGALFVIGERRMFFADRFTLYTEFATLGQLQPGAIVRVAVKRADFVSV